MCGVFGAESEDPATLVAAGITCQQHRGREAAGIASSDTEQFYYLGRCGRPSEIFQQDKEELEKMNRARYAIGHNRYSITGSHDNPFNVQPVKGEGPNGVIYGAHNGNFPDALVKEREELVAKGAVFTTSMDSEVLVQMVAWEEGATWLARLSAVMRKLVGRGTYTLIILTHGGLLFARDPHGNRPASYGRYNRGWVAASENSALRQVGATNIKDLSPGEVVQMSARGLESVQAVEPGPLAFCSFEVSYLSLPTSNPDGISISSARRKQGVLLAQLYPVADADVVIGVPDSGMPAGLGYAFELGLPYEQLVLRDRESGERTFIEPDSAIRQHMVERKYHLDPNVAGKRVVLVEDSTVRGITEEILVRNLFKAGAKSIDLRHAHPPIRYDCPYGVDMKTDKGLIAAGRRQADVESHICQKLGVRSCHYLRVEQNAQTQGRPLHQLCYGCTNGNYILPGVGGFTARNKTALEAAGAA